MVPPAAPADPAAGALLGGELPPAAMPMATAARAKLAPAKQAAEAWMLLGCVQCKGQAAHEVQYPHLIKVTQPDLLVRKEAAGLLQRMIEWMAKRANALAAAAGEGQQWPFVAGAFREFCRLLAETETIPQHPFTMWMRIHEVRGKPPSQAVRQAATEGLQHCNALLTQLEARLLFFPL